MSLEQTGTEQQNAAGTGASSHGIATDYTFESEEFDWLEPPMGGAGFYFYWAPRFEAYLARFGPGEPLPPFTSEQTPLDQFERVQAKGFDRYTYFARGEETGRIKIGQSRQPLYRMSQLGEPMEVLLILRGEHLERAYHRHFKRWHIGGEWFAPHPHILAEIERLK